MRDLRELHLEHGDKVVPPPTDAQLALVERIVGAKLPSDYKAFLRFSNGGYLELNTIHFGHGEDSDRWMINDFLRVSTEDRETEDTSEVIWHQRNKLPGIPRRSMPFVCNSGGDALYLDLSKVGRGRVVLYTHDPPSGPTLVAESFAAFIDELGPMDEDIAAIWNANR